MKVFLCLPVWLQLILVLGGSIGSVYVGMWLMHCKMKIPVNGAHNEITGYIFSVAGVLYALLLAFLITAVWEGVNDVSNAVSREAAAIITIARYSEEFPNPVRHQVYDQLRNYAELVINDEWKRMSQGNIENNGSLRATVALNNLYTIYRQYPPAAVNSEAMRNLDDLSSRRILRLMSGGTQPLPRIVWIMLVSGAIIIIYFSMILYLENLRLHIFIVSLLTILIVMCLWSILNLSNAFIGGLQVSPDALKYALHVIDTLPK